MTDIPETRYAMTADGLHIAYQVVGAGPVDVVFTGGLFGQVEAQWDFAPLARFVRQLASFSRVICFDTRGAGLSDPVALREQPTLEQRCIDLLAVLDAVECEQAALLGGVFSGQMLMFFAASYPERTAALVLCGCFARLARAPDYPWGISVRDQQRSLAEIEERGPGVVSQLRIVAPSAADDPAFVSAWSRVVRLSAAPGASLASVRMFLETDLRPLLPTIQAPTLVLYRARDRFAGLDHARYLADHIPGAKLVEVPGEDTLMFVGDSDAVIEEVEEFLTGVRGASISDRVLATVLFTDIVGSTDHLAGVGDRAWRDQLDSHDRAVRRQLERFRGREINTAGDGFLATFDGPGRAIRCACAIRDAVRALGIDIRVGLHTGEIEVRGEDIAGMAVHIGARVAALGGPGEVLVSGAIPPLVVGSGTEFADRGEYELKGVPGMWRIFAVEG